LAQFERRDFVEALAAVFASIWVQRVSLRHSQVGDWFDLGVEGFVEALGGSWCRFCLDMRVEGFVEALGGPQVGDWLDLGVEGFVEALGDSWCRICLDLGVEGFVEALGGSQVDDWLDDVASMPRISPQRIGQHGEG